jgi:transketolase
MPNSQIENEMANAIRSLSMDAVEKANSGHPGLPLGCADIATVLFTKVLKFDPADPHWPDRDRFVLSAGHGSMLLYSVLYLLGYEDMTIGQIETFRQLGSKTPGHPEHGFAAGVEATTGPLGQGIANGVGMALAEAHLRAEFGADLVDHHTFVLCGDGDLMEGISQEAIALAGHLQLNKLTIIWDDNRVTLDGKLEDEDSTDQHDRFRAVGWHTISVDGHDQAAVEEALRAAKAANRPTMIAARTTIGYGAPTKSGTSKAHGAPLGAEEIAGAKQALGITYPPFVIPNETIDAWRKAGSSGAPVRAAWQGRLAASPKRAEFERRQRGDLPEGFAPAVAEFKRRLAADKPKLASRKASQNALEIINGVLPETLGGSADLTSSNFTNTSQTLPIGPGDFAGRYVRYGVREHAMAAAMNGIALHGGLLPYGGTFLTFSDYARPAIRLAAIMKQRVVYVMTHDSIGLGEDGPTHQPVEHLSALRAIPDLQVLRPADATETLECWQIAVESMENPTLLALSRQNLPALRSEYVEENLSARGGYVIAGDVSADVAIFASGSEVAIAIDGQKALADRGIAAKVISVPSIELFFAQPDSYRAEVIGKTRARVAVEAGVRMSWDRLLGDNGRFVGMHSFGASAPIEALYTHFDITPNAVVEAVMAQL